MNAFRVEKPGRRRQINSPLISQPAADSFPFRDTPKIRAIGDGFLAGGTHACERSESYKGGQGWCDERKKKMAAGVKLLAILSAKQAQISLNEKNPAEKGGI